MTTSGLQPVEDNLEQAALERRAKALREVRIRRALLNGLFYKNPEERVNAINNVTKLVKEWAKEYYPPELERSAAGTVTRTAEGDRENVSGVSSPLYNNNSSKRSSISDGNNPNSPLFTDGSGSASATSYAASPVVESEFNSTPMTQYTNEDFEDVRELRRDVNPDGPVSDSLQRRKSTDMSSIDNSLTSEDKEERKERLRLLILTMLRMSIDCPFADVRNSFNKCLAKLRMMDVPVPEPVNPYPSCYISPEETITLEWPEYTPPAQSIPRSTTPSGRSRSSSCSSASSSNSAFSEEIPRVIQPLTPSTPLYPTSPVIVPLGRQPDDLTRNLMINTFVDIGRLSHFYRILAYFPSFMEKYQKSYNSIIRNHSSPGPLPISWRFYIGIMAASQHKCRYAVSKLTDDFILCGGNIDWLRGLEHAPIKIRNLAKLNTILAHQPWRLKASDIGLLAKGSKNPQDNWALAEIVHAIVILSTFHSLSSYALGCGIVPEYDSIEGNNDQSFNEEPGSSIGIMNPENISSDMGSGLSISFQEQSAESDTERISFREQSAESDTERTEETTVESTKPIIIQNKSSSAPNRSDDVEIIRQTNELIERLKQHELQVSAEDLNYGSVSSDSSLKVDFANVEVETFEKDVPRESLLPEEFFARSAPTNPYTLAFDSSPKKDYFSRFLDPKIEMPYEDFDVNSPEYSVFKLGGDNCWEIQGVVMVNRFLPSAEEDMGIGELLDREFSEVRDLTDYRLFHSYKSSHIDLDTKPLRQAVWFYVQRLYGLLKDDYTYRDLNTFLNMKIKKFLKKICCKPEEIKFKDWRNIGFNLREEEKCHVNLIAVEARKQAELVYGLTSVANWDKERDKEGMLKNLQV